MKKFKNIPICGLCWERRCESSHQPGRIPIRVALPNREQCGYCGEQTQSGIYVRDNVNSVPFPPKNEE